MRAFLWCLWCLETMSQVELEKWKIKFEADQLIECVDTVPLSVASCYKKQKDQQGDVNFRYEEVSINKWLGMNSAFLSATFILRKLQPKYFCEIRGLDTMAVIIINNRTDHSFNTNNTFATFRFDVTELLIDGENIINIEIKSPIKESKKIAQHDAYQLPPECPSSVQHGQCHINRIRKPAYSFSWDWGPLLADSGLYYPIKIYPLNNWKIIKTNLQLVSKYEDSKQIIRVDIEAQTDIYLDGNIELGLIPKNGLKNILKLRFQRKEFRGSIFKTSAEFEINRSSIDWWWPNGHGSQTMYQAEIIFAHETETEVVKKAFGFRTVELVQEVLTDGGRSFFFKINSKPIFMSGSNWIPASNVIGESTKYYKKLLDAAKDSGMNMLRVWGGGFYENDEFYDLAAARGITLWQDFMFACSTYSSSQDFLHNVRREVNDQLWRLSGNPAIVIFAGNNENEAALATNWYGTKNNEEFYDSQYRALYVNTIRDEYIKFNLSIPFVCSSPSNGRQSEIENFIASNPYDIKFGDVHYYNYENDCRDWSYFPKTRFASEFGYQSFSLISSIENVTRSNDRYISSPWLAQRNHHINGNFQITKIIRMLFGDPKLLDETEAAFQVYIYLSQISQGICTASQASFYLSRSSPAGTMGALYWQLNDVWTAASWSSIDHSMKLKPLHYEIKRVFNHPISVISNQDNIGILRIVVVSALTYKLNVDLKIITHSWDSLTENQIYELNDIWLEPNRATEIFQTHISEYMNSKGCLYGQIENCFLRFLLESEFGKLTTWHSPVPFKDTKPFKNTMDIQLELDKDSCVVIDNMVTIDLVTNLPQPFVWIETSLLHGNFIDNNILVHQKRSKITWNSDVHITCGDFYKSLRLFYPAMAYTDKYGDVPFLSNIFTLLEEIESSFTLVNVACFAAIVYVISYLKLTSMQMSEIRRPLDFKNSKPRLHKIY